MNNMVLSRAVTLTGGPGSRGFTPAGQGYVGPGDIVSGARAFYGLRAYNAAYATGSNPAIDIFKSDGSVGPTTINILASGDLDVATISGLGYATVISKLYDHTGNGNHLVQATNANRPALTLSGLGSKPVMSFQRVANFGLYLTGSAFNGGVTIPQPFTISAVAYENTYSGYQSVFGGEVPSTLYASLYFHVNSIDLWLGADFEVAKAAATWYAIQGVANGASGDMNIDGTANSKSTGTQVFPVTAVAMGCDPDGASGGALDGKVVEAGIWPSAFSGANSTSMSANQHAYWGF